MVLMLPIVAGLEVLCLVLRRLAYPCRYVDLEDMFQRPSIEIGLLFNIGVDYIDTNFRGRLTDPAQPWLTVPKLMEYCQAVRGKGIYICVCV